mgnify:CR=1 FL=1
MKVLVLGAGGMAGHVIATYLSEQGHIVNTVSASNKLNGATTLLDATNTARLREYLENNTFDIVINCIGILIQQSESRKDLAAYLNSYLPHFLERFYRDEPTRVIHLSTDCVFSGKHAPYREDSPYDGEIYYDRSKALGEIINDKDLTFRMSIIGPDMQQKGIGLFNWFYAQTGKINGYQKALWNGITTIELAKGINAAIEQKLTGLYHLVPNTHISKYELLKLFVTVFDRNDITVEPETSTVSDKTLITTRTDFDYTVPSYEVMLTEMKQWIESHQDFYAHYR